MSRTAYIGAGAAPLVAGAVLSIASVMNGPLLCPFQTVTGLPCPLCGATRAFVLLGHGDGRWIDYGAVWVAVAVALIVAGLARLRPRPWMIAPVAAVAWMWALAHQATITS